MSNQLTAIEIRDALKALREEIGPRAYVQIYVAVDDFFAQDGIISGVIYPDGIPEQRVIRVAASDFASILAKMSMEWAKASDAALHACAEANEIASNGPFKITPIAALSNAA